ncbi:MAG: NAD(P)H-dependent glycerol-3-phosphate dehydrogenase [Pseudomonadota bacterium]
MTVAVVGAGAFGTSLAITWARAGKDVVLWGRDPTVITAAHESRQLPRLPGAVLPDRVHCTAHLSAALAKDVIAFAVPAQTLRDFAAEHAADLSGKVLIACCKGIDLATMQGPASCLQSEVLQADVAMLTGPSFAADLAKGLPTALTLACGNDAVGQTLQGQLSTATLRLYRTTDIVGAELGGALKNVMAIACGITMGAGLGDSARAALMTRGFIEMETLTSKLGGQPDTLGGLSGFGDLVLTCTSPQSRNFRFGFALGQNAGFNEGTTVEGVATAKAVVALAETLKLDLPICRGVADVVAGRTNVAQTLEGLMARPLKEE